MFPSIGAEGNKGLIIADKMEPGEGGELVEASLGGGDCGGSYGWGCEDSLEPEVLARLGGGGLQTRHG